MTGLGCDEAALQLQVSDVWFKFCDFSGFVVVGGLEFEFGMHTEPNGGPSNFQVRGNIEHSTPGSMNLLGQHTSFLIQPKKHKHTQETQMKIIKHATT